MQIDFVDTGLQDTAIRILDSTSPVDVGGRLRRARKNTKFTQQQVADAMGIARTTLVAIEKGQRHIRIDEVRSLADLYGLSAGTLLRQEAVHVDFVPRFRKLSNAANEVVGKAAEIMSRLAKAEAELENLLGIQHAENYPPERPILRGDVKAQAESNAHALRQHLGIGHAPIADIVTLLEMEMDVRVYIRRVDDRLSGLFAHDKGLGPCILLNANHNRECRAQSAAHQCGHLVSARSAPAVLYRDAVMRSREERYAHAFGRAFLMPPRTVMQKCQEVTAGSNRLARRSIIMLAHFFGVSCEAMVRRLEELDLARTGSWDWFQANGGITGQHARQMLGDRVLSDIQPLDADRPTPLRLSMLANEVYRQELLSEGQLSELLDLDRITLRKTLDSLEMEAEEAEAISGPRIVSEV